MHGHLAHFAINADDLPATVGFYESLFGWSFDEAYPGFFRSKSAGAAIAAVQGRRALLEVPTNGFECTFAVDDVAAAVAAAEAGGGKVLMLVVHPATFAGCAGRLSSRRGAGATGRVELTRLPRGGGA